MLSDTRRKTILNGLNLRIVKEYSKNKNKTKKTALGVVTNSESQTESDVSDGVDAAVDGRVTDVHQVAEFRHHRAVDHADGEAESGVGHDQVVDTARQRNLKHPHFIEYK